MGRGSARPPQTKNDSSPPPFTPPISRLPFHVPRLAPPPLPFAASRFPSPVSRLPSPVSRLPSPVSRLPSPGSPVSHLRASPNHPHSASRSVLHAPGRLNAAPRRHQQDPADRLRADRHRSGLRVRLLGHAGREGADRARLRGRPRQLEPGDDHDGSGARASDLRRAARARDARRPSSSASAPTRSCRRSAARRRSTSRSRCTSAACSRSYGVELHRRAGRRHPQGRGSPALQGGDDEASASSRPRSGYAHSRRRGARRSSKTTGYPGDPAAELHDGRRGRRHRRRPERARRRRSAGRSQQSPTHEVLVEESVLGWKEFELEVIRDRRTTSSSSARSRTSIRWACTPATRSRSRRR